MERTAARLPAAFSRLAWSNLAAQSAEQIGLAAAPLVAVLALGAGAGATGLLQTAQTLPFLLLAIPAGVLADRAPRRVVMAGAEAVRAASLLAILALAWAGGLTLPLLAALGFVGAAGTVAYSVAAPALVPALVPPAALVVANGRLELARTTAFVAGPALAGALVGWAGATPAFTLATALSACAALLLTRLREPARSAVVERRAIRDIADAARFVLGHTLLRPVLITQFVFNAAFFALQAVYVPYAVSRLGFSASVIGATLAAYGVGMVIGALLAPRLIRAVRFGWVVVLGPLCGFAAAVVMVATVWVPSAALAGASFFLIGIGPIVWVISTATLRQTVTPRAMLGRVSAINIATYGARPLGAGIGALIGAAWGAEACLVVAALGFLLQAVTIVRSPVRRLACQPEMAT